VAVWQWQRGSGAVCGGVAVAVGVTVGQWGSVAVAVGVTVCDSG
jgi:hypothetical protein